MKAKGKRMTGCCLLVLSLLAGLLFPDTAEAKSKMSDGHDLRMTVIDQMDDTLISGAVFGLYYIASITEENTFKMSGEFESSGVSLDMNVTEGVWSARALTLEGYLTQCAALGHPIEAVAEGTTDKNGTVIFDGLEEGLYLLAGEELVNGNIIYIPYASLITMTHSHEDVFIYDAADSAGISGAGDSSDKKEDSAAKEDSSASSEDNITVYVKNELLFRNEPTPTPSPEPEPTPTPTPSAEPTPTPKDRELSVVKIWEDNGAEKRRPTSVTVTLYKDGEEYSTVQLKEENNWKYTWTVPEDASRWQLTERVVPQGYTVTVVQDGNAFIVTNTYEEETPKKTTTSKTSEPSPSASPSQPAVTPTPSEPVPSSSPSPAEPTPSEEPAEPTLPQTGQMWWPACLLAGGGLVLFLIGFGLWRKGSDADEKD